MPSKFSINTTLCTGTSNQIIFFSAMVLLSWEILDFVKAWRRLI
jgi:hypothetical protein